MASDSASSVVERPAPGRGGLWRGWLYYGLLVPPLAWSLQLLTDFALASHACFPQGTTRASFLPGWEGIWTVLLIINLVCLAASIAGLIGAFYSWRRLPPRPAPNEHDDLLGPGEGRLRVFAASGFLISFLFTIAILFNTSSLSALSTCSQA
ncbi:MAG TPA: hypothetical protein VKV96_01030 [Roseiarcus sp.]|nr:hypothetical protein [Roseiarcus sp.]